MLSDGGNQNGEKTTIGLISKKATLHVQHTFYVHFLAVVLHDYNVKLPETSQLHFVSYVFSFTIFFTGHRSFLPCIGGRQHFSCCHPRYKNFMLFFPKKISLFFILFNFTFFIFFYLSLQISVALFIVKLRWPAAYFLFLVKSNYYQCCVLIGGATTRLYVIAPQQ